MDKAFKTQEDHKQTLKSEVKDFNHGDLADIIEYCVVNCFGLQKYRGERIVTYEEALMQVYIPEILRRLRTQEEADTEYHSIAEMKKRIEEMKK